MSGVLCQTQHAAAFIVAGGASQRDGQVELAAKVAMPYSSLIWEDDAAPLDCECV
ncbi:MAG: hypothetical protein P1U77_23355 [Rubripirellula sp.]|nr:hypothetical protein [Rubripirellula sp.]